MSLFKKVDKRDLVVPVLLLGIGLLRLIIVRIVILEPWRGILVDSVQYRTLANNLLNNGTYYLPSNPELDLFRTPGYPSFLALILGLTKGSLGNVLMVQALLVIVSAFILYELGRTLGMGNLGAVAGLFLLLSPNTLFWSVIVMTETLFATGLTLAFLWMVKAIKVRFPVWGVSILMGVITLIRPIGVILILVWAIWLFIFDIRRRGMKIAFLRAIGLLIVSLIVLLPWCVRNARQHGIFTLSNVNRVTLYSYHLSQTLVESEGISWEEAKTRVTELGGIGSAIPVILREYPGPFIRVQLRGIARTILGTQEDTWLWLIAEDPYIQEGSGFLESLLHFDTKSLNEALKTIHSRDHLSVILLLLWGVGYTAVLFCLSIVGVIKGLGRGDALLRGVVILGLLTVAYLIVSPGAAGEARFRVPAEPILAFFASLALMKKAK